MTIRSIAAAWTLLALAWAGRAPAEEAPPPGSVVACDDLITLRRLMSQAPDRDAAKRHLPEYPGCREVARAGEVERRAIIGGAPFECLRQGAGACVWILP